MRVTAEIEGGMMVIALPLARSFLWKQLRLTRARIRGDGPACAAKREQGNRERAASRQKRLKQHVSALLKKFPREFAGEMMIER